MYILTNDARSIGLDLPLLVSNWKYLWLSTKYKRMYRKMKSHEIAPSHRKMASIEYANYCKKVTSKRWQEVENRAKKAQSSPSYAKAREESYNRRYRNDRSSDEMGWTPPYVAGSGSTNSNHSSTHDAPSFEGYGGGSSGGGGASGSWGDSSSSYSSSDSSSSDSGGGDSGGGDGGGGGD